MRRRELQVLAGIVAFAAIARFATLDEQSFWYDEAVTVGLVEMSLGDMVERMGDRMLDAVRPNFGHGNYQIAGFLGVVFVYSLLLGAMSVTVRAAISDESFAVGICGNDGSRIRSQ